MLSRCRVIVSTSSDVLDGVERFESILKKWYRVDAKLLKVIMGYRWCVEHYAPVYTVRMVSPEAVLVDLKGVSDFFDIQIGIGDLAKTENGPVITPLFTVTGVDLQAFLRGEASFAKALASMIARLSAVEYNVVSAINDAVSSLHDVAERMVNVTPGAFWIIQKVLSRYNVSPRDVVDYVTKELAAEKRLGIAPTKEMAVEQVQLKRAETGAEQAGGGEAGGPG